MKITKYALLLFASTMQMSAMEVMQVTEIEEPTSPFNYFDREESTVDLKSNCFAQVAARHLPTMRTYFAFTVGNGIKGYYQEKYKNETVVAALDAPQAATVFFTLLQINPKTHSEEKKALFNQLHATLFPSTKSKLLELHKSS